ncbi:hypothetical protein [Streptomyces sp. NPDC051569]|uniref:hypothetical protein n=1 Tax=Streptomyces sp. NPDC051569 TaxID=3365661 RepID=UPI00378A7923
MEFGDFTEHIATRLRHLARLHDWPAIVNSAHRPVAQIAADLCDLIDRHILPVTPAPESA